MATDKLVQLKRYNGTDYDPIYPGTKWSQILDKPTTFTPTAHTHVVGDISATGTPSSSTFLRGDGSWATVSDTNTTYTFASGTTNGAFSVTPSGGSAQSVAIYGLGSAAYTASTAYAASSHAHGSITSSGTITSNTALGSGDRLVFIDTSTGNGIQASSITFGSTATSYLCNDATWRTPLLYSVITADKFVYNSTYIDTGLTVSLDANSYYQISLAGGWGRITTTTASALRVSVVSAAAAGSSAHYGSFEFGALDTSTSMTDDVIQGLISTTSGGTFNTMSTASATTLVTGAPLLGLFSVYTGASAVTLKLTMSASTTTADGVYLLKGTSLTAIKVG